MRTFFSFFIICCFYIQVYPQSVQWMQLVKSSQYGNFNQTDNGWKGTIDKKGNGYSAGNIGATAHFGSTTLVANAFDMYVCKYNKLGKFSWAQLIKVGDPYANFIQAIETDNHGNLYVLGYFKTTLTFNDITIASTTDEQDQSKNIFLAKYDSSGIIQWAKGFGGTGSSEPGGMVLDTSGNIFICGSVTNDIYFDSHTITGNLLSDIFIAKISPQGIVLNTNVYHKAGYQSAFDMDMDPSGNLYLCGNANENAGNDQYTFHMKYAAGLELIRFTREDVYLYGFLNGIDTDPFGNMFRASSNIIVKYDASGTKLWQKELYEGPTNTYFSINGIKSNKYGDFYITGYTFPYYQLFIKKLSANGTIIWGQSSKVEGSGYTEGNDIATDDGGNLYITGTTYYGNTTLDGFVIPNPSQDILIFKVNDYSFMQEASTFSPFLPGVDYSYYEQGWTPTIPDLNLATPLKKGFLKDFSLVPANRGDNFSFQYNGFIEVPNDGLYTFSTLSDDGSKMYIDELLVVKNDGVHPLKSSYGKLSLKAGKHPFTVEYFENEGNHILQVYYEGPGVNKQIIPFSSLYRQPCLLPLQEASETGNTENGLSYTYYQGAWNTLPDFTTLTGVKAGTVNNFDLSPKLRSNSFGFNYVGFIDIPEDDYYTFYLNSDDGSKLYIDDQLIVSNDGLHIASLRSGMIGLKQGKHKISVDYFQYYGLSRLEVTYGRGFSKGPIPDAVLYKNVDPGARLASNEETIENEYTLYPVPATNQLTLSFDGASNPVSIEVVDVLFKTIQVSKTITEKSAVFDVSSLSPGFYYLVIQNETHQEIKKFMVMK